MCMQYRRVRSLDRENPRNRKQQPAPVSLVGKFHGQRSLVGYSPGIATIRTCISNIAHTHNVYGKDFLFILIVSNFILMCQCVIFFVYLQTQFYSELRNMYVNFFFIKFEKFGEIITQNLILSACSSLLFLKFLLQMGYRI